MYVFAFRPLSGKQKNNFSAFSASFAVNNFFEIAMKETENMKSKINALVIGAGNFGQYYARIISKLNNEKLSIPLIDKLIITRTQLKRAEEMASLLRKNVDCIVNDIIAAEVNDTNELIEVLEKYRPEFIGITARDKVIGDTIHAVYSAYALKYGAVLCEKPFANASGDGTSLKHVTDLFNYEKSDLFSLELPFAVVMRDLMQKKDLADLFVNAKNMEFYWETMSSVNNNIIDALAIHPWSLIPDAYKIEAIKVEDRGLHAQIIMQLYNNELCKNTICKINLKAGSNFRGVMIDNYAVAISTKGVLIKLIELNKPIEDAANEGKQALYGKVLLELDNPLKQNIIAVLKNKPIVSLKKSYDSQLFLERLHGFME